MYIFIGTPKKKKNITHRIFLNPKIRLGSVSKTT